MGSNLVPSYQNLFKQVKALVNRKAHAIFGNKFRFCTFVIGDLARLSRWADGKTDIRTDRYFNTIEAKVKL